MRDEFSGNLGKSVQSMTNASKTAVKIAKDIERAGQGITNIGKGLTTSVTTPILGVGVAAGKLAYHFKNGMPKLPQKPAPPVKILQKLKK